MFSGAAAFNQPIPKNGDKWDTAKVTDMKGMFQAANLFNQDLKTWDTTAVTNMASMFKDAADFNLDLTQAGGKWDTGEVTTMQNMFNGAAKFDKDLTSWKTKLGKVTNNVDMWTGASAMTSNKKPCTTPATSAGQVTWPAC